MSHAGSVDIIDFILLTVYPVIALAVTLFYQARRSKIDPKKSDY